MSIVKWNPFQEFAALHEDMNRLFARMDGGEVGGSKSWMLPMDVVETEDALKLRVSLPGIDPKDINLTVEDRVLTVSAQRHFDQSVEKGNYCWVEQQYGTFTRSVTLPQSADANRVEAQYQHGILELTIPKREEAKPRRIELKVGEDTPKAIEAGGTEATPAS